MSPNDRCDLILSTLRIHSRRPWISVPRRPWRIGATGRVSALELARATGTSVRTVYRDVEALRARGFTIGGMGGRGGGFWLDPESRPSPVSLDVEEITRLALAMRVAPSEHPDARDALIAKLLGALPNAVETELRVLLEIVQTEVPVPEAPVETGVLTTCRRALFSYRPVRFLSADGAASVLPEALIVRDGAWHVRGPAGSSGPGSKASLDHRIDGMRRARVQLRMNPWPPHRFAAWATSASPSG
ncbi:MAG: HTH domain-containing protein [Myxococcota bacterium]